MRLRLVAAAIALAGTAAVMAGPAAAQDGRRVITNRDRTVIVSRDENGRTRTRIIIQKRSYLDPGTAALPSDRNTLDYAERPDQRADDVLDHTAYGMRGSTNLPGPWTLPFPDNPWLGNGP
ncbi:MAG TPA: hypothetical protein VFT69_06775 [Pseudolabrys sp.]|nr:hypothetical protein [Pseudolabrys sp.]